MDTTAYLHSQGWLGAGHALAARGLSKPLLVSQKQNVLGVGKKRHDAHADQWWARAFDGCLKGLEVSRVVEGRAKEKDGKKEEGNGEKGSWEEGVVRVEGRGGGLDALRSGRAGLYGFFVRGEGLRGTFVEEAVGAVNGDGVGGVEKGVDGKKSEGQGVEDRAERRRRRKERNSAEAVVVVGEEVVDEQLSKRLRKEERRKRRRDRDGAEDGAMMATAIAEATQGVSSPSLPKKKRRRVEACDGGSSPELITSEDRDTTETPVSGSCKPKATDEAHRKAMQRKDKSSVEKLERRRRRAARKALEAEQNQSADGQAGQEAGGTNKTHRKKKGKHSEKQVQALE